MKQLLAALPLVLIAGFALAHPGAHINPHADDPSWIPVILGSVAISVAALIWVRK
jgi:aspartyl/asparaginyl beta-hydroxylase (cupin superfamily)